MRTQRLIVVGASGHGRVAMDAARSSGRFEIVGWADTFVAAGTEVAGLRVLGKPAEMDRLAAAHRVDAFFLGISDNVTRAKVREMIHQLCPDLPWCAVVHPGAMIARDVEIGAGALVLAGAVVNTQSRIGEGCIVNTRASLDHDGVMKRYSSLLPGVVTGGDVEVGEFACVCLGAHVAHRVKIGDHAVVGAGSVVLHDVPSATLAYGVPARVIRSREPGERHF